MNQPCEIFTIDEIASYLKAGRRTVYRLVGCGKRPALKLGGTRRFRRGDWDMWIASRMGTAMVGDAERAE